VLFGALLHIDPVQLRRELPTLLAAVIWRRLPRGEQASLLCVSAFRVLSLRRGRDGRLKSPPAAAAAWRMASESLSSGCRCRSTSRAGPLPALFFSLRVAWRYGGRTGSRAPSRAREPTPWRRIHKCWPGVPPISSVLACISPRPVQNLHNRWAQAPRNQSILMVDRRGCGWLRAFATQSWLVWVGGYVVEPTRHARSRLGQVSHASNVSRQVSPRGCCRRGPSGIVQTPSVQKVRR
jgi:hypothetical protein